MIAKDKDSLICDLAETYQVYDMHNYEVGFIAVLVFGLPQESRIKKSLSNQKVTFKDVMLAGIFDVLNQIRWMLAGNKHAPKPISVLDKLLEEEKEKAISFMDEQAFEMEWERITGASHGKWNDIR